MFAQLRRLTCFLSALSSLMAPPALAQQQPQGNANFFTGRQMLEHLYRHSDALLLETNLLRLGGYRISPQVLGEVQVNDNWSRQFLGQLRQSVMANPRAMKMLMEGVNVPGSNNGRGMMGMDPQQAVEQVSVDVLIGLHVALLRVDLVKLYERWCQMRQSAPQVSEQFALVFRDYQAVSPSIIFYVQNMRKTFEQAAQLGRVQDPTLSRRIDQTEAIANQIDQMILVVNQSPIFGFNNPNQRNQPVPQYDAVAWEQRWSYIALPAQPAANPGPIAQSPVNSPFPPGGIAAPGTDPEVPLNVPATPGVPSVPNTSGPFGTPPATAPSQTGPFGSPAGEPGTSGPFSSSTATSNPATSARLRTSVPSGIWAGKIQSLPK